MRLRRILARLACRCEGGFQKAKVSLRLKFELFPNTVEDTNRRKHTLAVCSSVWPAAPLWFTVRVGRAHRRRLLYERRAVGEGEHQGGVSLRDCYLGCINNVYQQRAVFFSGGRLPKTADAHRTPQTASAPVLRLMAAAPRAQLMP